METPKESKKSSPRTASVASAEKVDLIVKKPKSVKKGKKKTTKGKNGDQVTQNEVNRSSAMGERLLEIEDDGGREVEMLTKILIEHDLVKLAPGSKRSKVPEKMSSALGETHSILSEFSPTKSTISRHSGDFEFFGEKYQALNLANVIKAKMEKSRREKEDSEKEFRQERKALLLRIRQECEMRYQLGEEIENSHQSLVDMKNVLRQECVRSFVKRTFQRSVTKVMIATHLDNSVFDRFKVQTSSQAETIRLLQRDNHHKDLEIERLKKQNDLETRVNKEVNKELEKRVEALLIENNDLSWKISTMQQAHMTEDSSEGMQSTNRLEHKEIQILKERLEEITYQNQTLKSHLDTLYRDYEFYKIERAAQVEENQRLIEENLDLKSEKSQFSQKSRSLQQHLKHSQIDIETLTTDVIELHTAFEQFVSNIESKMVQPFSKLQYLEEKFRNGSLFQGDKSALLLKLTAKEEMVDDLLDEKQLLQERLIGYMKQFEDYKQRCEEILHDNEKDLQVRMSEMESEIHKMKKPLVERQVQRSATKKKSRFFTLIGFKKKNTGESNSGEA